MRAFRIARSLAVWIYVLAILGTPTVLVVLLYRVLAPYPVPVTLATLFLPAIWLLSYVLVCGSLSLLTRSALIAGKFPRDLGHPVYGPRRLHALCWTSIYYFTPLYHLVLTFPLLRRITFRLFGYQGQLNFTIYPDSWIRDLPLLDIGAGAYIANRATLGTNICLRTGDILVEGIRIGARATIGHLAILGLGDTIGDDAEIGVGTTLGMRVHVGAGTVVGAIVGLNHGATIGARCRIDSMVYIGRSATVHDGLHVHYGSIVPDRAILRTQADADLCRPTQPDMLSRQPIALMLDTPPPLEQLTLPDIGAA